MNKTSFLPITVQEMEQLGWDRPDFVLVTGDAYVDHPSFGTAIIGRTLEKAGFRVAILPQPDWHSTADFKRFGRPRLGFLINSGNIDSMVNHYTTAKKKRSNDAYTPGGLAGARPDRAVIVYTNRVREAYKRMPIVIGGIEASLRRFAHYDYWDDKVRRSILTDSGADLLIYGMGERPILQVANALNEGVHISEITSVAGTAYSRNDVQDINGTYLPDFDTISKDKDQYNVAFLKQHQQASDPNFDVLLQKNGKDYVVINPPAQPLSREEMDATYALQYTRQPHPSYQKHIPAIDEVSFSITSCRGCFGSCSFCALAYHQGRVVHSRSHESIVEEAKLITEQEGFKGYIHDVGGPTANFRNPACAKQEKGSACAERRCLFPKACKQLRVSHTDYVALLRKLRKLPKIKKVFIRSGLRYDYILEDKDKTFLNELVEHHVSGQLKIAPEHIDDNVLSKMGKPSSDLYEKFVNEYNAINKKLGKEQYVVPYFMSSHPGSDLNAAIALAVYMKKHNIRPEQVQDFYPTPGTMSTAMFYTGKDPYTGQSVYVPKSYEEKKMQRVLLQYYRPENAELIRKALKQAGREDLIGFDKNALVRPYTRQNKNATQAGYKASSAKNNGDYRGKNSTAQTTKPKKKRARQKSTKRP